LNDGLRLDENQRLLPSTPDTPQQHPEQFLRGNKARLRMLSAQNGELLPKSQILQQKIAARAKEVGRKNSQEA
jgi:hypothetical protein